ncbi:MAG TPA: sigma-70 family RNA polymerase sigma factor [Candidatus Dormibacteraeota bacterium]|nr:sigma-70 family RNA polymerase sigma factor [Candidatus Dormibacteraeota bacterium]
MQREARATEVAERIGIEQLFEREHDGILRLCLAILRNQHDAEEAAQEAFVRVVPRLATLRGEPGAYLNVVARRICAQMLRSSARSVPLDFRAASQADTESTAAARHLLRRTWAHHSTLDRTLIFGRYAGYRYDEMARRTGLSAKSVSVGLHRARVRARALGGAITSLLPAFHALRARLRGRPIKAGTSERYSLPIQSAALGWFAMVVVTVLLATSGSPPPGRPPRPEPAGRAARSVAPRGVAAALSSRPGPPVGTVPPPAPGARQGPPAGVLPPGLIGPGPAEQPEDAVIAGFSVSPNYVHDHTVFASGTTASGCAARACPALFVSHDGARSWVALPATGFVGHAILFPPTYPADPTLFAAGTAGLLRSGDGGLTFIPVAPFGPGAAVVDPASVSGDTQVLIGSAAIVRYHDANRVMQPEPFLIPNTQGFDDMSFAPVSGDLPATSDMEDPNPSQGYDALLTSCGAGQCQRQLTVPASSALALAGTPTEPGHGLVMAWSTLSVWLSGTPSLAFARLTLPAAGLISGADLAPGGRQLTVALASASHPYMPVLYRSLDGGQTWQRLPAAGLAKMGMVTLLKYLPDGRLLAAVTATAASGPNLGVACSEDAGQTWTRRC